VSNYFTFLGKSFHNHAAPKRTFERLIQDCPHCQGHEIVSKEICPVEWRAQLQLTLFIIHISALSEVFMSDLLYWAAGR
jgi:hypothetical protein